MTSWLCGFAWRSLSLPTQQAISYVRKKYCAGLWPVLNFQRPLILAATTFILERMMNQVYMGSGGHSPAVVAHLQKKVAIGGGGIVTPIAEHLKKKNVPARVAAPVEVGVGGGGFAPAIAAHLAKQR